MRISARQRRKFGAKRRIAQGEFISPEHFNPKGPHGINFRGMCGITFEKFQDIKQGDIIEAFIMEQIEV